ncbi:hypothetical protein CHU98_g6871 [Xylaria longipes]|nr:hypothetical protein CHU98_g6871 [Xylaria longipes]
MKEGPSQPTSNGEVFTVESHAKKEAVLDRGVTSSQKENCVGEALSHLEYFKSTYRQTEVQHLINSYGAELGVYTLKSWFVAKFNRSHQALLGHTNGHDAVDNRPYQSASPRQQISPASNISLLPELAG